VASAHRDSRPIDAGGVMGAIPRLRDSGLLPPLHGAPAAAEPAAFVRSPELER